MTLRRKCRAFLRFSQTWSYTCAIRPSGGAHTMRPKGWSGVDRWRVICSEVVNNPDDYRELTLGGRLSTTTLVLIGPGSSASLDRRADHVCLGRVSRPCPCCPDFPLAKNRKPAAGKGPPDTGTGPKDLAPQQLRQKSRVLLPWIWRCRTVSHDPIFAIGPTRKPLTASVRCRSMQTKRTRETGPTGNMRTFASARVRSKKT